MRYMFCLNMITRRKRKLVTIILVGFVLSILIFVILSERRSSKWISTLDADIELEKALGSRRTRSAEFVLPNEDTVLGNPNTFCRIENGTDIFILFMVISAPANKEARDVIRNGMKFFVEEHNAEIYRNSDMAQNVIELLFFTGMPKINADKDELFLEAKMHRDMILENLEESYLNFTLKSLRMLKWVDQNCGEAQFTAKIDDDVHLNLAKFYAKLKSVFHEEDSGVNLIGGDLRKGILPVRSPSSFYGKFYVPYHMWSSEYFPDFLSGCFYVFGKYAKRKIFKAALEQPLFPLEDVFVTGIIGHHTLRMKLTNFEITANYWTPVVQNLVTSSCQIQNNYFAIHFHAKKFNYLDCWKHFNHKNFTCSYMPLFTYCYLQ